MDWDRIKSIICEGRRFTISDQEACVLSDAIMPSGAAVFVHMQLRQGELFAHDGGAAFDELSRQGMDVRTISGAKRMLGKTNFRLGDDGRIWRDRFEPKAAALLVSLVSDASLRAAHYLLAHGHYPAGQPLDVRVKDSLRARYPGGRVNFTVHGKNRQHVFDFGITLDGKTYLIETVTPDSGSVSAAIVKGIDAREAPNANVVPLFIYDPDDEWKSGALNMLAFGGTGVSVDRITHGDLPIAA